MKSVTKAIQYLELGARCCSPRGQCLVQFNADCCCAADPQQRNCDPCDIRPAGKVADYVCKCGRRLYIVEVTERGDLLRYKNVLCEKYSNTRSATAQYGPLAPVLVIVSHTARASKELRDYFQRQCGASVILARPSSNVC